MNIHVVNYSLNTKHEIIVPAHLIYFFAARKKTKMNKKVAYSRNISLHSSLLRNLGNARLRIWSAYQ